MKINFTNKLISVAFIFQTAESVETIDIWDKCYSEYMQHIARNNARAGNM